MQVGSRVKIINTNSFWDNKEGVIEEIDEENNLCTVFVDFNPEEGKRVRQDFSLDNVEDSLQERYLHEDVDIDLINDESNYQDHIREELADCFNVDLEDVFSVDDNIYEIEGKTYFVGTYEEAYREAVARCEDIIRDLGLEAFSEDYKEYVINNFLDVNSIKDWIREYYDSYVDDIEDESDEELGNRLIQELYDNGILSNDDFNIISDGETFDTILKDEVDLESKKHEYAEMLTDREDPISWLESMYSEKELAEFIDRNGLLDVQACAEDCVDTDDIAHTLASYDEEEIKIRDDLYAYRIN